MAETIPLNYRERILQHGFAVTLLGIVATNLPLPGFVADRLVVIQDAQIIVTKLDILLDIFNEFIRHYENYGTVNTISLEQYSEIAQDLYNQFPKIKIIMGDTATRLVDVIVNYYSQEDELASSATRHLFATLDAVKQQIARARIMAINSHKLK